MKPIQEGDLVTVNLGEYQSVSNTYLVAKKLEHQSILSHPLAPECLILKDDSELNKCLASMQNAVEKCLFYSRKNKELLGVTMNANLEALCFYFVIKKSFTLKQRDELASICGKIASVVLENKVASAVMLIKQNRVLLDEFNQMQCNQISKIINDPISIKTKNERYLIFNIAGFILAQLSNS